MTAVRIRIQHNSMQFSDDRDQHAHDAKVVFDFATNNDVWAVTGTESGSSPSNHDLRQLLIDQAHAHNWFGYFHKWGDWVALNRRFLHRFDHGYMGPFIPGTHGLSPAQGAHSPRGITWAQGEAKSANLGLMTFGAAHYLTAGSMKVSGSNQRLVNGIGKYGHEHGGGKKLVFFDADANEHDDQVDVFRGKPFTTIADELHKHPKTHGKDKQHGSAIDIISSYDHDGRVTGKSYRVLDDSDLHLYADHFLLLADYNVREMAV